MTEKRISATEFKAKCLSLLDEVSRSGGSLVVTKHGTPVARVTKASARRVPFMGGMRGRAEEVGDIVNFDTTELWESLR